MSRRQIPSLTQGAIPSIIQSPVYADTPNLQVLGWKNLQGESSRPGERSGNDRYRILLSDGKYSYAYGMLATQLNHLITDGQLESFTIIKVKKVICNKITSKTNTGKDPKKIIIILELDILMPGSEVGDKLGNPHPLNEGEQVEDAGQKPQMHSGNKPQAFSPKKPQPQSRTDQSSVVTHPIVSLTPYQNKWTVKVRVTNKGEIRTWSNSRGDGKLFSMDLMDDSGEIRATAFNAECDKYYHMIETNKVYYISGANLKSANKQYTSIKNDYEMSFNSNTQVTPCYEDASDIPQVTFNFVPISELSKFDKDNLLDVIGVAKSATDVTTIVSRTTNKELKKREVHLVDSSNTEVNLTLWGKTAEEFDVSIQPVIAMKGVKLSDFGGRSLGVVSQTVFQINPDMPEAHKLRGWYDNIGCTSQMTSISVGKGAGGGGGSSAWKTFTDVKLDNLGNGEKPDYYTAKAMVAMINKERALYMACPSSDCNKKVVDLNNGLYRCEKCQQEFQDYKWRVMLSVNITDFTDHQWVTCFQEAAETLLGRSADELGRLKDSDTTQFQKVFEDATFKWFVFRLRVKMEMYNDENRLKTTVFEVKELNYKDYNERMIREIKELSLSH